MIAVAGAPIVSVTSIVLVVSIVSIVAGASVAAHEPPPLAVALPPGAVELGRAFEPGEARLDLFLAWPDEAPSEAAVEAIVRAALADELEAGRPARGVVPWVAAPDGGWEPLVARVPRPPPVPERAWEAERRGRAAIAPRTGGRRSGALSGKHVYVSAGHGFTWDPDLGRWVTQRGNTHGIVEDLVSAETVDELMIAGLENAGATVWTVRERDTSPLMVIVDDAQASAEGAWAASTAPGFAAGLAPYEGDVNPFTAGGTQYTTAVAGAPTATMTWPIDVPAAGDYGVYVSWSASGNRVTDAHYVVQHAGGQSHHHVDQTRHGGTWFHLGRYRFEPGAGAVVLGNDTAGDPSGKVVAADVVRVGGGMGDLLRGDGVAIPEAPRSGRPRWEENARYFVQYAGAPAEVYAYTGDERSDDVGARSRYADWQREGDEDAVYVAWHTNAPSPGRGTSTYVYGPNPPDGSYDFTGVAGSDDLARALHDTLVAAVRARFDPDWRDRGVYSAYFGELNPRHNDEMPSALVEVAFHATAEDAAWLEEPAFRMVAARAFVHGIVKYFSDRDGVPATLPPDPPAAVRVQAIAPGRVRVAWRPPAEDPAGGDPPERYRVYRSRDGRAFDDGAAVTGPEVELDVPAGEAVFVRVSAENAGGESFPSPVLAARPSCEAAGGAADVLVVMGFYRLDAAGLPAEDLSAWDLGQVRRGRLAAVNRFDYVVEHAAALAAHGLAFDSAEADADVSLDAYRVVDWLLGEESSADETLSSAEQARIGAWLAGAGRTLLVSGAELAWDLGQRGSADDQAFLASLGVGFAADDAGTYTLEGGLVLDDGTRGTYAVDLPDVLTPVGGAEVALRYGDGQVAGTTRALASGSRAVVLGVPLEALSPEPARAALLGRLVPIAELAAVTCEPAVEPGPDAPPESAAEDADLAPDVPPATGAEAGRASREVSITRHADAAGCQGGASTWPLVLVSFMMMPMRRRRS